jgi:hypothetical protein
MNNNNNKQTEKSFCERVREAINELNFAIWLNIRRAYLGACIDNDVVSKFPYAFIDIYGWSDSFITSETLEEIRKIFEKYNLEIWRFLIFANNTRLSFEFWIRPKQ